MLGEARRSYRQVSPWRGPEYDRHLVSRAIVLQWNRTRINRDAVEFG
jgi:hypothetical protein